MFFLSSRTWIWILYRHTYFYTSIVYNDTRNISYIVYITRCHLSILCALFCVQTQMGMTVYELFNITWDQLWKSLFSSGFSQHWIQHAKSKIIIIIKKLFSKHTGDCGLTGEIPRDQLPKKPCRFLKRRHDIKNLRLQTTNQVSLHSLMQGI